MELDTFFSLPRWKILEIIAKRPSSPLEISKELNTSVSYVSQQLKLLETAGLLTKRKTGVVEKGKPRMIFSLVDDFAYLSVLASEISAKKLLKLTDHHKLLLRIWLLSNSNVHYYIEKLYWTIEEDLGEIRGIFFEDSPHPRILVLGDGKRIRQKIDSFSKNFGDKISCSIVSWESLKKMKNLYKIYDPALLLFKEEMKGGESK